MTSGLAGMCIAIKPSPQDGVSLEHRLGTAREAGYRGIELPPPELDGGLRAQLDRCGVALVASAHATDLLERTVAEEIAALRPHLEQVRTYGARVCVITERPRVLAWEEWQRLAAALTELGDFTASLGFRLAVRHGADSVIRSAEDIDRLLALAGPRVGLALDTGALAQVGADPAAILARHAARVHHVYLRDMRGDHDFALPGEGTVDFAAIFHRLGQVDYPGWLVVDAAAEQQRNDALGALRRGYRHVRGLLERFAP